MRAITLLSAISGFTQACASFIFIGMETTPGFTSTTTGLLLLFVSGLAAAISGLHHGTP